jgi:flagellar protein FlaI
MGARPAAPAAQVPISSRPVLGEVTVLEKYPLNEPYVQAVVAEEPARKAYLYLVDELKLNDSEIRIYSDIMNVLHVELKVPRSQIDPKAYFAEHARSVVARYRMRLGRLANVSWAKILYYAERDMVGFGPIDPLMRDPNIEDISVDGVGRPVFVWHRRYESLETNLSFDTDEDLNDLITRLVHLSGKHISTAYPVVDATLPGRHRLAATYRREVSPQGSTLTIRKFRDDPITVVDMLGFGTLDHTVAAYAWLLMESRASTVVVGATAAGKTTMLNSLLTMVRPGSKIVTIEEVQEINIPHQNWIPLVARPSYGLGSERIGEVNLYDLVKASLRMRPDELVVGEVRGEEAYVLFQAISTGHGGMCSLHADDVRSAMQRLTSKPMDVAESYIPFLDVVFTIRRVAVKSGQVGRRVMSVDEVIRLNEYFTAFEWDPLEDAFSQRNLRNSVKLRKLARDRGLSVDDVLEELERRIVVLKWLEKKGLRNYRDLGAIFDYYHHRPSELLGKIKAET